MSELVELNVIDEPDQPEEPPKPPPSRLRRIGCALALVIWFTLLLTPCFLFVMATQGEIAVNLGSAPGQDLRIWLIMEADERGFGVSRPTTASGNDANHLCVQTDVRYLLWAGKAEPVTYCDCYERSGTDQAWSSTATQQGACTP
jgi:hypothetical protein